MEKDTISKDTLPEGDQPKDAPPKGQPSKGQPPKGQPSGKRKKSGGSAAACSGAEPRSDAESRSDTEPQSGAEAADAAENTGAQAAETEDEPVVKADDERFLRLAAEYDNFRKRTARERDTLVSDTRFSVLKQLLPVLDNLERAAAQPCQDAAYAQGVSMTLRQFLELLEKMDVKPIDAAGAPFDPNLHDAVMHVDDEGLPEQTVAEVFQTGYTAGGKVLRPSIVKVAN